MADEAKLHSPICSAFKCWLCDMLLGIVVKKNWALSHSILALKLVTEHQIWDPCIIRVSCLISKTFGHFPNTFLLFSFKLILYGLQWFIIIVLCCYLLNHIGKSSYKSKIDEYRLLYLHMQFPLLIFLISSCWFELQSNVLSFQAEGLPLTFLLGSAGGKEHSQLFVCLAMATFSLNFGRNFCWI